MKTFSLLFLIVLLCGVPVSSSVAAMPGDAQLGLECLFDEGRPTRHLMACGPAELMERLAKNVIFERYGISVSDRTARWSLSELRSLLNGLNTMALRFSRTVRHDATPQFKALFAGTVFYRDSIPERTIAYTIIGSVSFYDVWADYDSAGRTFYLAHEMGHLLDTRMSPLHLFMGEVSGEFAAEVGAEMVGGRYDLGDEFPRPTPESPVRHREDSASEDWAESFATVVEPEFESDLRDIGPARTTTVQHHMQYWVIDAAEEPLEVTR
jgi:hypothetical protein